LAGIYIHIPFCKQVCYYCNFHFSTSTHYRYEMVNSLVKEIALSHDFLLNDGKPEIIETIYFGGGTPSLLSEVDIKNLLNVINDHYTIASDAEITLEANPDDITEEKLIAWKRCGINRLSIGIQSFQEKDLKWMNRAHNSLQATESILRAKSAGFHNFSIDLIYGIPGLTDDEWRKNIDVAIANNIPHMACYALTIEPRTALQKMIELKKKEPVDAEQQARQFEILMERSRSAGYEHYEISNFAKPGSRSKHNSSYWQGKKYVGIGPSAHSYNGILRRWNVANNPVYIQSIKNNKIPFEEEKLTAGNKLNEYIMISLRTMEGINLKKLQEEFSAHEKLRIVQLINTNNYQSRGMIYLNEESIRLTDKGKLFADGIASSLFKV